MDFGKINPPAFLEYRRKRGWAFVLDFCKGV